jgi:cell division protein FtsB
MEFVLVVVILAVVVFVLTGPLRASGAERGTASEQLAGTAQENELAELEAEREAKYREIRDAELDHQTGKLSDADFAAIDSTLRAEAIEILRAIDQAGSEPPAPQSDGASADE